jgi:hypothetical protein
MSGLNLISHPAGVPPGPAPGGARRNFILVLGQNAGSAADAEWSASLRLPGCGAMPVHHDGSIFLVPRRHTDRQCATTTAIHALTGAVEEAVIIEVDSPHVEEGGTP